MSATEATLMKGEDAKSHLSTQANMSIKNDQEDKKTEQMTLKEKRMQHFIFRHFLFYDAKLSKLATPEDPQHIHKTLGILSIISFLYRYGYMYFTQGNLGFDSVLDPSRDHRLVMIDWATMLVHTLLSVSSLLFRVPRKRIAKKPMIIYEEYRQHATVFTLRCFLVYCAAVLFPEQACYLSPVVVMLVHLWADRISSIWGTPNYTAVRATGAALKLSNFYLGVSKLYSFYQFVAIASHILPNPRLADLAFNAIIAIQSSAFLMTLYRKRIVRGRTHMTIYSGCLLLSAFHIVRNIGLGMTALVALAFLMRTNLPRKYSNKYVIWTGFLIAANWSTCLSLFNNFYQAMESESLDQNKLLLERPEMKSIAVAFLLYVGFQIERMLFGETYGKPTTSLSKPNKLPTQKQE